MSVSPHPYYYYEYRPSAASACIFFFLHCILQLSMRSTSLLAALSACVLLAFAQHVHFEPPWVREKVDSMLEEYHHYTQYDGPPAWWWRRYPHPPYPTHPIPPPAEGGQCDYWLEHIKHQGVAAFNPNPDNYTVFRNVKDFGAKGDGMTDDTDAINFAISDGGRCGPDGCESSTTTPAVVYFPPGVYMINSSIVDYYYTQIIGNPNCLPTIRAFSTFGGTGLGLMDGNQYGANGLGFGSTNVFWRQIRNLIIDMTQIPASSAATGIHWPTAQATSIQNVIFQMSQANGTQHQGIFIEEGSGGFMADLVFNGGRNGATFGNQQFTMRNLTFNNAVTAISQIWDWGWTYYGININNCSIGLDMYSGGPTALSVGSVTFFDSSISNTPVGIRTGYTNSSQPPAANSLILENVRLSNVPVAVQGGDNRTALAGTPTTSYISAWGQGHAYTPNGPNVFQGPITPVQRAPSLVQGSDYYQRSKPQYGRNSLSDFVSARDLGATGDGHTDDTKALQRAINVAKSRGKILFVDHGDYLVSSTIRIPSGSKIVGETYSVILSQGAYFNDLHNPQAVVQIGAPGESGSIEWSDMIVSTQGQQRGAILFEYNLKSSSAEPSGLWDVHARIGGFAGSQQQLADCPTTPNTTVTADNLDYDCIADFLTFHITKGSGGLYLENAWIWTADHDIEDPELTRITLYTGRGMLVESTAGTLWLVGTSVEHHVKYEYQFLGTRDVFTSEVSPSRTTSPLRFERH